MSDLTQQEKLANLLRAGDYGKREDGTRKGTGYFGPLMNDDGDAVTELSFDFDHDGRNVLAPLVVPTLNAQELRHLLSGARPTDEIYGKAEQHAIERGIKGRSPFAQPLEVQELPR